MYARLPSFVLGFHGCDEAVGESILLGEQELIPSANSYDWLGSGRYFWENNPDRAMDYARMLANRKGSKRTAIIKPFVIGAVIDLGHCLNLLDHRALEMLRQQLADA